MTTSCLILKISESELSFLTGLVPVEPRLYLYVERGLARSTDSASFFWGDLRGLEKRSGSRFEARSLASPRRLWPWSVYSKTSIGLARAATRLSCLMAVEQRPHRFDM